MPAPAIRNVPYASGDYTVATACSLPVFDAPFKEDGIKEQYILRQDFMQLLSAYVPLDLDTPHPDYSDFILVEESEQRDVTGGRVRWTRTYAKVPDAYEKEVDTVTFTFPGKSGLVTGGVVGYGGSDNGRLPLPKTVDYTRARAFFLNPAPGDLPILKQFQVTYGVQEEPTAYLNDNATNPNYDDTAPSRTEYEALVAAGEQLITQDSARRIWMGNIYMRETIYVTAQ